MISNRHHAFCLDIDCILIIKQNGYDVYLHGAQIDKLWRR